MKKEMILRLRKAGFLLSARGNLSLAQSLLRRCFRHAKETIRVDDFDGDLTIHLKLSEHMQRRIFWMGYYNREIVALLNNIIDERMVFIDVGANIGEITLVAARRVGFNGRVISFEPVDAIATELEMNVTRNRLSHVTVVRAGLSDMCTNAPIYASCGQEENHGLGSLYEATAGHSPLQMVTLTTLDQYVRDHPLARLDIVKIDIEGAELACLKGAEQTLKQFSPLLIIEIQEYSSSVAGYQSKDILNYLSSLGYTFKTIGKKGLLYPLKAEGLSSYQNVLCVPTANASTFTKSTT